MNTFFTESLQWLPLKLNIFMLQLSTYYILEYEILIEMRAKRKKLNIFMLQLLMHFKLQQKSRLKQMRTF